MATHLNGWNIALDAERSNADGSNWDSDKLRLAGRLNYPITDKLSGLLDASVTLRDFDNTHTAFNVKRDDETYAISIGASYEIIEDIDFTVRNTTQQNNSNTSLYGYKRNVTNVGIQKNWRF